MLRKTELNEPKPWEAWQQINKIMEEGWARHTVGQWSRTSLLKLRKNYITRKKALKTRLPNLRPQLERNMWQGLNAWLGVTLLEAVNQITCIFLQIHKRLYTPLFETHFKLPSKWNVPTSVQRWPRLLADPLYLLLNYRRDGHSVDCRVIQSALHCAWSASRSWGGASPRLLEAIWIIRVVFDHCSISTELMIIPSTMQQALAVSQWTNTHKWQGKGGQAAPARAF